MVNPPNKIFYSIYSILLDNVSSLFHLLKREQKSPSPQSSLLRGEGGVREMREIPMKEKKGMICSSSPLTR
jgi:hypothetical protein